MIPFMHIHNTAADQDCSNCESVTATVNSNGLDSLITLCESIAELARDLDQRGFQSGPDYDRMRDKADDFESRLFEMLEHIS